MIMDIPQERSPDHIGEQTVDVPVLHDVKEIREMIKNIQQILPERVVEPIVDVYVPQVANEILGETGEEIVEVYISL